MILFVAPVGVALAHRRPKLPPPYPHLSLWRLLGGEIVAILRDLWERALRLTRQHEKGHPTMGHESHTRQSIHAPSTARELEVIVRRLWATEPRCSRADRMALLTELGSVGLALERIILRGENRNARPGTDDDLRSTDLADCERRIENLLAHWPGDFEAPSPPLVAA